MEDISGNMDGPISAQSSATSRSRRVRPRRSLRKRKCNVGLPVHPCKANLSRLKFNGYQTKHLNTVGALAMRSEGRCVVRNWQNEMLRRTLDQLRPSQHMKLGVRPDSNAESVFCRSISVAGDGYIGAWSKTVPGELVVRKIKFQEATDEKLLSVFASEYFRSSNICRIYDIASCYQEDGTENVTFAGYWPETGHYFYECLFWYGLPERTLPILQRFRLDDEPRCVAAKGDIVALGTAGLTIVRNVFRNSACRLCDRDVLSLSFSPCGNSLFYGDSVGVLHRLDFTSDLSFSLRSMGESIRSINCLSDGHSLVMGCAENTILLCDIRMNKTVLEYPGHVNRSKSIPISISEGHDLLCLLGGDGQIRFWRLSTGDLIYSMPSSGVGKKFCYLYENSRKIFVCVFNSHKVSCYQL